MADPSPRSQLFPLLSTLACFVLMFIRPFTLVGILGLFGILVYLLGREHRRQLAARPEPEPLPPAPRLGNEEVRRLLREGRVRSAREVQVESDRVSELSPEESMMRDWLGAKVEMQSGDWSAAWPRIEAALEGLVEDQSGFGPGDQRKMWRDYGRCAALTQRSTQVGEAITALESLKTDPERMEAEREELEMLHVARVGHALDDESGRDWSRLAREGNAAPELTTALGGLIFTFLTCDWTGDYRRERVFRGDRRVAPQLTATYEHFGVGWPEFARFLELVEGPETLD